MSGLSAFLKQNKKNETESVKFVASKNFVDAKGNPIEWEIKALSSKKAEEIRTLCNKVVGNKVITDNALWQRSMAAACTVYPNLNDAELQDSYGVMNPADLIVEMLDNDAEYQAYCNKCSEVCGYTKKDSDLVLEVKN